MKQILFLLAMLVHFICHSQCASSVCITFPGSTPAIFLCEEGTITFEMINNTPAPLTGMVVHIDLPPAISLLNTTNANSSLNGAIIMGIPNFGTDWTITFPPAYTFQANETVTVTVHTEVDCQILGTTGNAIPHVEQMVISVLDSLSVNISFFNSSPNINVFYPRMNINSGNIGVPFPLATPPPAPPNHHYVWQHMFLQNPDVSFNFSQILDPLVGVRIAINYAQNAYLAGLYKIDGTLLTTQIAPLAVSLHSDALLDITSFNQITGINNGIFAASATPIEFWALHVIPDCNIAFQTATTCGWNCEAAAPLTFNSQLCYLSYPPVLKNVPASGSNPNVVFSALAVTPPVDYCYGPANNTTYSYTIDNAGLVNATNLVIHFEDNLLYDPSFTTYSNFTLTPPGYGTIDQINHTITIPILAPADPLLTLSWSVNHECPSTVDCTESVFMDDWMRNFQYMGRCDGLPSISPAAPVRSIQEGGGLLPIGPGFSFNR
jgi:hypothetical protein